MGIIRKKTTKQTQIKSTMKFASIIAIAAALAFTAEAQGGNGDCDGQGGGKKRGRIPKRLWESTGTLLGCKATIEEAEEEGPVGVDSCTKSQERPRLFARAGRISTIGRALMMLTSPLAPLTSMFGMKPPLGTAWTQTLSTLRLDPSLLETTERDASKTLSLLA